MNTDTEALTEKLWDAITEIRDDFPRSHRDAPTTLLIDAAILPILRAAQADAWDEGSGGRDDLRPNPYREQED